MSVEISKQFLADDDECDFNSLLWNLVWSAKVHQATNAAKHLSYAKHIKSYNVSSCVITFRTVCLLCNYQQDLWEKAGTLPISQNTYGIDSQNDFG